MEKQSEDAQTKTYNFYSEQNIDYNWNTQTSLLAEKISKKQSGQQFWQKQE